MIKTIRSIVIAAFAIVSICSISSCRKDVMGCTYRSAANYNPDANIENGTCQYTGKATFWFDSGRTDATVTINGQASYITQYYPIEYPSCGSNGCANFILTEGTYSYHVENTLNIWNGSMNVNANECSLILLN